MELESQHTRLWYTEGCHASGWAPRCFTAVRENAEEQGVVNEEAPNKCCTIAGERTCLQ